MKDKEILFPAFMPGSGEPIVIVYEEMGYYPVSREKHADLSDYWVWSEKVIESAISASMWGWRIPAAEIAHKAVESYRS